MKTMMILLAGLAIGVGIGTTNIGAAPARHIYVLHVGDSVDAGATGWFCGLDFDNFENRQRLGCQSSTRSKVLFIQLEARTITVLRCSNNCAKSKTLLKAHE